MVEKNNYLTDEEMKMLDACQSSVDWGRACDVIKKAYGGEYPKDWYEKVIKSGFGNCINARWGDDMELHIDSFDLLEPVDPRNN